MKTDRTKVRLSDSVRVTLSVEGESPLRVEVPDAILAEQSAAVWRSRPAGPATVTDIAGGRQRWERTYRLDPYLPGKLPLGFAPATASVGKDPQPKEVVWKPIEVEVTTEVTGATEPRPPTGIEELPPVNGTADSWQDRVAMFAALGVAIVAVAVAGIWLLRHRRRAPPLSPEELAAAQLDELVPDDPAFADRLSDVLREYVEARTPTAASRLTTAELHAELERENDWPVERVNDLIAVLDTCDAVKFAAWPLTPDDRERLLATARGVVTAEVVDDRP